MKQQCHACGIEKDISIKEIYPYPDDGIVDNQPIAPLMNLECQAGTNWRVVTVCHNCFHKLDVDMWISELCWKKLHPMIPFEQLPPLKTGNH